MLRLSEYRMMLASIMSSVSSIAFEFLIQFAKLQKKSILLSFVIFTAISKIKIIFASIGMDNNI